jgi:hypothetical protein
MHEKPTASIELSGRIRVSRHWESVSTPLTPPDSLTSGPRPCPAPPTTAPPRTSRRSPPMPTASAVPSLMFHNVPEGKTLKNRLHFDLQAGGVEVEAERLTRLGAKQIRSLSANNNRWISFIDPEGNEFDLVAG